MKNSKKIFAKKNVKAIVAAATVAATGSVVGIKTAHAGTASEIIKSLIGYVLGIFFWVGVVLLVFGIGQLVLAFKNEDGDSKSRAVMLALVAIVLMSLEAIVGAALTAANAGIDVKKDTTF